MEKTIDRYQIFNLIELTLLGLSIIADIISIFSPFSSFRLILFIAMIVFCIAFSMKYIKMYTIKNNILKTVTTSIHETDHSLRNEFFEMFELYHSDKMNIDMINDFVNKSGEVVSRDLSNSIFKIVGSEIQVVIKLFEFNSETSTVINSRTEADITYKNLQGLKIRTIGKALNGVTQPIVYDSYDITRNAMYVEALKVIAEKDCFIYSDTNDLVRDYHSKYGNKQFPHPRTDWQKRNRGVIIIPISDEKHTWNCNKKENSKIIGLIKVASNSKSTFNQRDVRLAIIQLVKASADSLYKCIERQKFYYSTIERR